MQQTAYIPGRKITDEILIIQDLMVGYHKEAGIPNCAIKVDIVKAYVTVRWDFLWMIMKYMGFPEKFIAWIKGCVTTAWFSISMNGSLHDFFTSSRGLRQGILYPPISSFWLWKSLIFCCRSILMNMVLIIILIAKT
ncbi:hypothetical protein LIER_27597 [Lithospermum erythrorhizon]|uniref:Reverse transcriptase domain-containing protein n=1 Tax=Lithospermum erythrorhizon TaxID=34254 RepID=A0AAV3RE60_LITER